MGLLKEINDTVWEFLLNLLKPLSDNVAIDILAISILYMIVIMGIRIKRNKFHVFNITDFIFVTSVGYMVERLPMIHKRIHLALTTVTNIISSSSIYSDAFTLVTNIPASNTSKAARYLYFLKDHSKLQYTEPIDLYKHLFRTLDKVRKIPLLGGVHEKCFGTFSVMFIFTVAMLILLLLINIAKGSIKSVLWYLVQGTFLIFLTQWNNGAAFCGIIIWFVEEVVYYFATEKENQKVSEKAGHE